VLADLIAVERVPSMNIAALRNRPADHVDAGDVEGGQAGSQLRICRDGTFDLSFVDIAT